MEINFPKLEEKILRFWRQNKIFEKSISQRKGAKDFVFYEGPPTANGKPGIHHVLGRIFKDIICRYKTMQGFRVLRQAGWDTHGLPVELEVEKKLGIKSKPEIEKYGIAKFNKECKKSVWQYKEAWEKLTERIGFWLDTKNPYITYQSSYIESVWGALKEIWQKNFLFQDFKVVPYCPRCGTSLSSHEVALGYKKIKEPAIFVKFPIQNPEFKNTSLLIWTTTPWTLPANVAVAVNPKFVYAKVEVAGEYLILAKERLAVLGGQARVLEEIEGEKLVGLNYHPPFDFYKPDYKKEKIWEVVPAAFVSLDEGTGLVHIAPAFGEDDMAALRGKDFPVLITVDERGKFSLDVKKWAGLFVKDADPKIIEDLRIRGLLFKEEQHEHDYPFCWRCRTPLLYYAKKSWFIGMSKIRGSLVGNNQKINWIPAHLKEGRFGSWLKEAKDWAISRERYWGTPLPIWRCASCQDTKVLGSLGDILSQRFSKNNYFILRHGESVINTKGLASCWPEKVYSPLTKKGERQIKETAKKLKTKKIDLIFSSDILRTKQTAEIVGAEIGIKPRFDKRLRDVNVGIFNGKPIKEAGKFWADKEKLSPVQYYSRRFYIPPPGGEDYVAIEKRMWSFLKETDKKYQNKTILIVSHKRPLNLLEKIVYGYDLEKFVKAIKEKKEVGTGQAKPLKFARLPYDEKMELDFHRPYIDEVKFFCQKCRGVVSRVPEVLDCWFDSGSMPFASTKLFPADYICEAVDQTRGWFYTLLAISTLLGFGPPYRNVISLGHILDEKGEKMSKSRGNVVDPWQTIEKYGIDAVRWYFYTINQPGEPKLFSEKDVDSALKKFILTFWNCLVFYKTYEKKPMAAKPAKNVLDRWIISRLNQLVFGTTKLLDKYDVTGAARLVERFVIEDLSLWYIRRSRKRFEEASSTLASVLLVLSKLIAPFVPFLSEEAYRQLTRRKTSVHLEDWPRSNSKLIDKDLNLSMENVRRIVSLALAERAKAGIKVRQPLSKLEIKNFKIGRELSDLIKDEVNVKEIVFNAKINSEVELDTRITPELREEGRVREVMRRIQEMRKEAGLQARDKVSVWAAGPERVLEKNKELILREAKIKSLTIGSRGREDLDAETEVEIGGEKIWLGIKKVK